VAGPDTRHPQTVSDVDAWPAAGGSAERKHHPEQGPHLPDKHDPGRARARLGRPAHHQVLVPDLAEGVRRRRAHRLGGPPSAAALPLR